MELLFALGFVHHKYTTRKQWSSKERWKKKRKRAWNKFWKKMTVIFFTLFAVLLSEKSILTARSKTFEKSPLKHWHLKKCISHWCPYVTSQIYALLTAVMWLPEEAVKKALINMLTTLGHHIHVVLFRFISYPLWPLHLQLLHFVLIKKKTP